MNNDIHVNVYRWDLRSYFFPLVSISINVLDKWNSVLKYRNSVIFIFLFLREEDGCFFILLKISKENYVKEDSIVPD